MSTTALTAAVPTGPWSRAWPWIALAGLCWFVFFFRLGAIPLYAWDESRLANSALEMIRNGDRLVTYYEGSPDFWSTKPPFLIWLIALSIKAFGPTEWAVRLPSAMAATITTFVLYAFLASQLRMRLSGFLASAALMSTLGYVAKHAARSGDYDAMLALWTTVYVLAFYLALTKEDKRPFYLAVFAGASALAFMTKTIAGLIFFAPLALYVAAVASFRPLLKTRSAALAFAFPIVVGCVFYAVRERATPGYFMAALHSDILGRYLEAIDAKPMSPFYYLLQPRNLPWFAVLPVAVWLCSRYGSPKEKNLTGFLLTSYVGYLLVISFAQTKQGWYALPLHPLCALMVGIGLSAAIRQVGPRVRILGGYTGLASLACAAATLLTIALASVLVYWYYPNLVATPADRYSYFLRQLPQLLPDSRRVVVLHPGYRNSAGFGFYVAPARFYVMALNDRGYDISLQPLNEKYPVWAGETVLECDDEAGRAAAPASGAVTIARAYGCTAWRF